MRFSEWNGFNGGNWETEIDVREFIQKNYTPYCGDASFLASSTPKTQELWKQVLELYKKEKESEGGVLDIDTKLLLVLMLMNLVILIKI